MDLDKRKIMWPQIFSLSFRLLVLGLDVSRCVVQNCTNLLAAFKKNEKMEKMMKMRKWKK
jgi:hypothetical protein